MLSIYYLCNSSISFAISVPILPAPRTVPEDIPGTFTKGCFTASTVKNQTKTQICSSFIMQQGIITSKIHFKAVFVLYFFIFRNEVPKNTSSWGRALLSLIWNIKISEKYVCEYYWSPGMKLDLIITTSSLFHRQCKTHEKNTLGFCTNWNQLLKRTISKAKIKNLILKSWNRMQKSESMHSRKILTKLVKITITLYSRGKLREYNCISSENRQNMKRICDRSITSYQQNPSYSRSC